ncbi:MAG: hypothetical protein M4579_000428 [Chaenotheca gracillima]|nr:MAG: hypothetical protein M4579_000428 [Chaenotheca gracillima]
MAEAKVVYTNDDGTSGNTGSLFEGQKFWVAQKVPQRSHLIEQIESNGGTITKVDEQADIKLVDHVKNKDVAAGCHSYEYVTASIRKGELEPLDDHAVGHPSGASRPVGSSRPGKSRRTPFTAEDDRILFQWVTDYERKGGKTMGNEIYKQLEEANPRHTFQSWRDRWVKTLVYRLPPSSDEPVAAAPTGRPSASQNDNREPTKDAPSTKKDSARASADFTRDEFELMFEQAENVMNIAPGLQDKAWNEWASANPRHTAKQWQLYFITKVLPLYKKQQAAGTTKSSQPQSKDGLPNSIPKTTRAAQKLEGEETTSQVEPQTSSSDVKRTPLKEKSPVAWREVPTTSSPNPNSQTSPTHHSTKRKRQTDSTATPNSLDHTENATSPRKRAKAAEVDGESAPKQTGSISKLANSRALSSGGPESPNPAQEESSQLKPRKSHQTGQELQPATREEKGDDEEIIPDSLEQPPHESIQSSSLDSQYSAVQGTQAIFLAQTQPVDFDVAAPVGGWDEDEDENEDEDKDENGNVDDRKQAQAAERVDGEEEDIDDIDTFHNPRSPVSPPPHEHDILETFPETPPRSSLPASPSSPENSIYDAWIDSHITPTTPEETVILALRSTSNIPDLAERVLASIRDGHGIPRDIPGVWMDEDDATLKSSDTRALDKLEAKHGGEGLDRRWIFLSWYEDAVDASPHT